MSRLILILLVSLVPLVLHAEPQSILIEDFTVADRWEAHEFEGQTRYSLVERDGRSALHAECDNSASGLLWRRTVDLTQTPWLHWSWRVRVPYRNLDERSKDGDDFVARVYVVRKSTLTPWRSMAVNYVWAGSEPEGASWPNPYTDRAWMFALQSGPGADWQHEVRNVRNDFREAFGTEVDEVDVVAIMSDCDDAGHVGQAWYDDIRFSSRRELSEASP